MKPKQKKLRSASSGDARAALPPMQRPRTKRDVQGRVHLVLQRDPATGREQLALAVPVFNEAWQNDLALAAANTALAVMGNEPSVGRAVELGTGAMASTSRLAEGLLGQAPEGAVACHAGCDHCCYQSVGVTPPEALAIFDHLTRTLAAADRERVVERLGTHHERTRGLSSQERFSPEHPCPFLVEARCSIYEVRPLSCRGMNSLDADECKTRLRDPDAREAFLARGVGGRSFMEPIRAFHAVSAGLQLALSERYSLDMRPLDLSAALVLLFSAPESVAEAWVHGEASFAPARGGDSTHHPNTGTLSGAIFVAPGVAR